MTSGTLASGCIPTHIAASDVSRQTASVCGGTSVGLDPGKVSQSNHPSSGMVGAEKIFSAKHFLQPCGRRQSMQLDSKIILFCLDF